MYQAMLKLVPYEDGEHVMVLCSDGKMDDAWYRASIEQLVDRYGRIIGRPEEIAHRRDKAVFDRAFRKRRNDA